MYVVKLLIDIKYLCPNLLKEKFMKNKLIELLIKLDFSLEKSFKNIENKVKDDQSYVEVSLLDNNESEFGKITIFFPPRFESKESKLKYISKINDKLNSLDEFLKLFTKKFTATFKINYIEYEEYIALDKDLNIMCFKTKKKEYSNYYKTSERKDVMNINFVTEYELGRYKLSFITTLNFLEEYNRRINVRKEEILKEINEITGYEKEIIEINSFDWFNRNLLLSKDKFETLYNKVNKAVTRNSGFLGEINKNDFVYEEFAFITRDSKYYIKSAIKFLSDFKKTEKIQISEESFFDKLNFFDNNFSIIYNKNKSILKANIIRVMLRLNKTAFTNDGFSVRFKIFDGENERYSDIKDCNTKKMFYRNFCPEEKFNELANIIDSNINTIEYATYLPKKLKTTQNLRKLIIEISKNQKPSKSES